MTLHSNFWINQGLIAVLIPSAIFITLSVIAHGFKFRKPRFVSAIDNVVLFFLNGFLYGLFFVGLAKAAKSHYLDIIPSLSAEFWQPVPMVLATLIALVVFDFVNYWNHRLLHTRLVWGVHAVHHSDQHMTWTTSYRVHLFEGFLMALGVIVMSAWMNIPIEALGIAGLIHGAYNKYVHCQLGWTHGVLRKWLISPNYHRWHHADNPASYNKNFGDIFAIWDRMFGTQYDPGLCETPIGLSDGPHSLIDMLVHPFKYWWVEYLAPKKPVETL